MRYEDGPLGATIRDAPEVHPMLARLRDWIPFIAMGGLLGIALDLALRVVDAPRVVGLVVALPTGIALGMAIHARTVRSRERNAGDDVEVDLAPLPWPGLEPEAREGERTPPGAPDAWYDDSGFATALARARAQRAR